MHALLIWVFRSLLLSLLLLAGCSPALNWREIRVPDSSIAALLPCEPDHATRSVPLGGVPTDLTMAGCDAAGATFAVMVAKAPAAQAGSLLEGWRKATLGNFKARELKEEPFMVRGALSLPESLRVSAEGQRADGALVHAQAIWAARIAPDGAAAELVHLVMYSERPMPEAAETFFSGLKLQ